MSRVSNELEKQRAAEASVSLVQDGMIVGLGTGSTVAYLLPALAKLGLTASAVWRRRRAPRRQRGNWV